MLFLTWNLGRSEPALRLALEYLKGVGTVVAALQEVPPFVPQQSKLKWKFIDVRKESAGKLKTIGSLEKGRVVLLASSDVKLRGRAHYGQHKRMLGRRITTPNGTHLDVVGLHAPDRRNFGNEFERGSWAARARISLETIWSAPGPLVVMGDFNADMHAPEIVSLCALYAVDDPDVFGAEAPRYHGRSVLPLYNPMHQRVCANGRVGGTYHLAGATYGTNWRTVDQIIVSPDIKQAIKSRPEIIAKITPPPGATEPKRKRGVLVSSKGRPRTDSYTDHLPVQLRVTL